jgi:GAF domain
MQRWTVSCVDGTTEAEGANWLGAVADAVNRLAMKPGVLAQMVCEVDSGRSVIIRNPVTGYVFLVERLGEIPPGANDVDDPSDLPHDDIVGPDSFLQHDSIFEMPSPVVGGVVARSPVGVRAGGPDMVDETSLPSFNEEDTVPPGLLPVPPLQMRVPDLQPFPTVTSAEDRLATLTTSGGTFVFEPAPADLTETLFMSAFGISGATSIEDAASEALDAVLGLVKAEAAAVLYAGMGELSLRFVAARGPQAAEARRHLVPLDEGVAGFVHRNGCSLIIQDAAQDERIHREVEAATGYRTQSMLAVVVKDSAGTIHGCLELLNPPKRFQPWHLDAALSIATSLGDWIGARSPR